MPTSLASARPHVVVLSSLFPSSVQPGAGLFIRERMFRVGAHLPLAVVAPTPWFPFQSLIQRWRPGFRPEAPRHEFQSGRDVWFPRFLCVPGLFKRLDGLFMALGAWSRLRQLRRSGRLDLIDAHFAYPDGYAATLLGRWLKVPVTITLRGTESRLASDPVFAPKVAQALRSAIQVFSVSESLRHVALSLGMPPGQVQVVGNGVDLQRFSPMPQAAARPALGLPRGVPVLVSGGGFVERKGFQRVIALLHALRKQFPGLVYLMVGDGPARSALEKPAHELNLGDRVRFTGVIGREQVPADVAAFDIALQPAVVPYAAPLKLFEYLALGNAIVAPNQPNLAEILHDGDNAVLFEAEQPGALESVLDRLCADTALRARLAAGALSTISRQGLTWRHNAQRGVVALAHALQAGGDLPSPRAPGMAR